MRAARLTGPALVLALLLPGPAGSRAASDRHTIPSAAPTAREFRHARFSHPLRIDNRWTPLAPGEKFVLTGNLREGNSPIAHRIVSIVTDLTKTLDGVPTSIVWERDYSAGKLAESELFFMAEDDAGTVWLFGEYPEISDKGAFQGAPDTWIVPHYGAQPGIFMRAHPRVGRPSYSQGFVRPIQFYDRARVLKSDQTVCVPVGCFHHVLAIDEWGPFRPSDGHQRKFYAPGIGGILVRPAGGSAQETLSLTTLVHLGPVAMAQVRHQVLSTEHRAYRVSKAYRATPPAVPRPHMR